jgi:hypothetical protein
MAAMGQMCLHSPHSPEKLGYEKEMRGTSACSGSMPTTEVTVICSRDVADDQVKGFVIERGTPGYTVEKLHGAGDRCLQVGWAGDGCLRAGTRLAQPTTTSNTPRVTTESRTAISATIFAGRSCFVCGPAASWPPGTPQLVATIIHCQEYE